MPSSIGQTLSIVGALVIGQAAVEVSLVSAPMIMSSPLRALQASGSENQRPDYSLRVFLVPSPQSLVFRLLYHR